jgi:hypothetical protein
MGGRAKAQKSRKHPNDYLEGGEKCQVCGNDMTILSSYKRHLSRVHGLSQKVVDEIILATRDKFFPGEERYDVQKVCPAPGCRAHFMLKSSLTQHLKEKHPR